MFYTICYLLYDSETFNDYSFYMYSLNVTTSGRNCNKIFDVLTSKMPNADRSKHAFVCVGDFVLIKLELQNKYDGENCNLLPVIL